MEGPFGGILCAFFIFPHLTGSVESGAIEIVGPAVGEVEAFVVVVLIHMKCEQRRFQEDIEKSF